jgi:hypothetical protein
VPLPGACIADSHPMGLEFACRWVGVSPCNHVSPSSTFMRTTFSHNVRPKYQSGCYSAAYSPPTSVTRCQYLPVSNLQSDRVDVTPSMMTLFSCFGFQGWKTRYGFGGEKALPSGVPSSCRPFLLLALLPLSSSSHPGLSISRTSEQQPATGTS